MNRKRRWRSVSAFAAAFLGLLHMEIIQERLEREYNLDLITTAPSVVYRFQMQGGETVDDRQPNQFPRSFSNCIG